MKIKLSCIGKTSIGYIDEGIKLYQKRVTHFVDFELICLPDIKNQKNMPVDELKKKEGIALLKNISNSDYLCLLDENGQNYTSEAFAGFIEKKMEQNIKSMVFMIGGAYGFSQEVYQRADFKLSLSKMTFSHQIVRLIFMEQLYRAFTIIKGIPYHNQ
jgi:23S rRNA (pseudouridine1915-N3)-methyltransferase